MSLWLARLLILVGILFVAGWGLVFVSGGSELVWRVGGVMVYASVAGVLVAALLVVLGGVRSAPRLVRCPSSPKSRSPRGG